MRVQLRMCMQVCVTYDNLPAGAYYVFIHTRARHGRFADTFHISISGAGLVQTIDGGYYVPLYTDFADDAIPAGAVSRIASASFAVETPCSVLFIYSQTPFALVSIQLKELEQEQLMKVSPQWKKVSCRTDFPSCGTAVRWDANGESHWLSLRVGADRKAQVGKIRPDHWFHYAPKNSPKEQLTIGPTQNIGMNGVVHPGVLVNAEDFIWINTNLQDAHALLERAVTLTCHGSNEGRHI